MDRLLAVVVGTALVGCGSVGSNTTARSASDLSSPEAQLAATRAELEAKETELRTVRAQLALARAEADELRGATGQQRPKNLSAGDSGGSTEPGNAKPPWLATPVTVETPRGQQEVLSVFDEERLATTDDVPELPAFIEEATLAEAPVADSGVEDYRRGLRLVQEQRFDEATQALTAFLKVHPNHPYADNALFWRGEVRFLRHDYEAALADFRTIEKHHPWGNKLPDALYRIGQIYQKRGDGHRARAYFDKVREQFPETAAARLALREDAS
ncbi:MAG: tol-pal system protein YbgF [Myxococcota bacterium]